MLCSRVVELLLLDCCPSLLCCCAVVLVCVSCRRHCALFWYPVHCGASAGVPPAAVGAQGESFLLFPLGHAIQGVRHSVGPYHSERPHSLLSSGSTLAALGPGTVCNWVSDTLLSLALPVDSPIVLGLRPSLVG